jgi:CHAT domain-containing protein/tetratricopeptide (TPR) repeat protein
VNRQFRFYLSSLLVAVLGFILTVSVSVFFTPNASLSQTPMVDSSTELIHQGQASFEAGDFADAVESLQQAVEGYRTERQPLKQALALSYLALAYQELGKWDDARNAMNAGFSIIPQDEAGEATTDTVRRVRAQLLNSRGQQELALGQAEKALASWQEAQTLYTQIDYLQGAIGTQVNQGQALAALGKYRKSCNLVLQALSGSQVDCSALVSLNHSETSDTVREARSLEEVLEAIATQPSPLRIVGLQVLGNTLRLMGKLAESKALLEESLKLAKTPQMESAIALSLGNTLRALTDSDWRKNDEIKSDYTAVPLRCFKNDADKYTDAINNYEKAARSLSPLTRVQAQIALLEIQPDLIAEYPDLLTELQQLPSSRASVYVRVKYAQLLACKSQDSSDSFVVLNTALEQAREIRDFRAQSVVLGSLGQLYERQENWEQAKGYTDRANRLISQISASDYQNDLAYQWNWQLGRILLKKMGQPYAIEHPNIQKVIEFYEAAVNTLKELRKNIASFNPDIQYDFRDEVEPVYRQYIDLLLLPNSASEEVTQEKLKRAVDTIEELQISEINDFFRDACAEVKKVEIDKLDSTAAVFYTILLPDRLEVIVFLPDRSLKRYTHHRPQEGFEFFFKNLRFDFDSKQSDLLFEIDRAQQAYNWLIRDVEPELQKQEVKTLVFILDGALRKIPISALHDGEKYLIEKYPIAITPGFRLFPPQTEAIDLQPNTPQILAVGRSDFEKNSQPKPGFSDIQNVEVELNGILGKFNQPTTNKLFNESFTTEQLSQVLQLGVFPIVHFATHGQFNSNAEETFIIAWDEVINLNQLGTLLRSSRLDRQNPNGKTAIDLLVFSACQTAEGNNRAILGMAGAAIRAGARSTIATLWNVNDASTAHLMTKFYEVLSQMEGNGEKEQMANPGRNKAEALRQAQLALLRGDYDEEFRNPHFWSPFVLVGNWL